MSRLQIGLGAREALDVPGTGTVLAVYRRAAYLRLPGGIVALVAPGVPPGPLWIRGEPVSGRAGRLPHAATAGDQQGLSVGASVTVGQEWLDVAGMRLPIAGADAWIGRLPDPVRLRAGLPLAMEILTTAPRSVLLADPWLPALRRAEAAVQRGELCRAATFIGGLGPGLTPAGDDALAGILLAHRALSGAGAEPHLLAAARSGVTTDVSAALLVWAARGQAVEPVHDLLTALAAQDWAGTVTAARGVASLGASSGADLLLGLRLGLVSATAGTRSPTGRS
ncbi:MAG: DUF2877 domain-containing protein [Actinomycetota bacterium]|nr:DUF2877 domain-containing protein [Actinomycetota bacterium]